MELIAIAIGLLLVIGVLYLVRAILIAIFLLIYGIFKWMVEHKTVSAIVVLTIVTGYLAQYQNETFNAILEKVKGASAAVWSGIIWVFQSVIWAGLVWVFGAVWAGCVWLFHGIAWLLATIWSGCVWLLGSIAEYWILSVVALGTVVLAFAARKLMTHTIAHVERRRADTKMSILKQDGRPSDLSVEPQPKKSRRSSSKPISHDEPEQDSSERIRNLLHSMMKTVDRMKLEKAVTDSINRNLKEMIDTFDSPLLIAVLGEYSSGKSTFLNALMRRKMLPMKSRETTATITILRFGEKERAEVHFNDGHKKTIDIALDGVKSLDDYLVEKVGNDVLDRVGKVVIEMNNPLLQQLDLADTPGFNSEFNRHTEMTKKFIGVADLVVWLFDTTKLGKASEIEKIEEHCKHGKPIGIGNCIDLLPLRPGQKPEDHCSQFIQRYNGNFEKFFFVSAYNGLNAANGQYAESGMLDVSKYFSDSVIPSAKERKKLAVLQRVRMIGNDFVNLQKLLVHQISMNRRAIADQEQLIKTYQDLLRRWNESVQNWNREVDNLRLSNIRSYFLVDGVPAHLQNRANAFISKDSELTRRRSQLSQMLSAIDTERAQLDVELGVYQQRRAIYDSKGWKALGDDIWEGLFGSPASQEKIQVNHLATNYESHRLRFNESVDKWNRSNEQLNQEEESNRVAQHEYWFQTVITKVNEQKEKLDLLAQKVETGTQKARTVEKQLTSFEHQNNLIRDDIYGFYKELLTIVSMGQSESSLPTDLESLLSEFDIYAPKGQRIDWNSIYTRERIENIAAHSRSKAGSGRTSRPSNVGFENRQATQVK